MSSKSKARGAAVVPSADPEPEPAPTEVPQETEQPTVEQPEPEPEQPAVEQAAPEQEVSVNQPPQPIVDESVDPNAFFLPPDTDPLTGRQIVYLIELSPCDCKPSEDPSKVSHLGGVYYKPEDEQPSPTVHFNVSVCPNIDGGWHEEEAIPIRNNYMSAKLFDKRGPGGRTTLTSRLGHHFYLGLGPGDGNKIDRTLPIEDQVAQIAGLLQRTPAYWWGTIVWDGACDNQGCKNYQPQGKDRIRGSRRFPEHRDAEGNVDGRENSMQCGCGGTIRARAEINQLSGPAV